MLLRRTVRQISGPMKEAKEMARHKAFAASALASILGFSAGCAHYYSKFVLRPLPAASPSRTYAVTIDSDAARDRIRAEELRQAEETRRIGRLPVPGHDPVAVREWSSAVDQIVDLGARAKFVDDLKKLSALDLPPGSRGMIIGGGACRCGLRRGSSQLLVLVRFRLPGQSPVNAWVCDDSLEMLHHFEL